MGFFQQVSLLMWKNWILQKRSVHMTVLEICLPLVFAVILIKLRDAIKSTHHLSPVSYEPANVSYTNTILNPKYGNVYLVYTPKTPLTDAIMKNVLASMNADLQYGHYNYANGSGFESEADMLAFDKKAYAIIFKNLSPKSNVLPNRVEVILRPTYSAEWFTKKLFPLQFHAGPKIEYFLDPYIFYGFLYIQRKVSEAFIMNWNPKSKHLLNKTTIELQRMAYPPYKEDKMYFILSIALPLFILLSFIICVIQTTKGVVYEKEFGLKESMKLMGLYTAAHWVSWFLTTLLKLFVTIFIYALLISSSFSKNGPVLFNSDPVLIIIFLLLYAMAVISFSFMISVFIQKSNVAAPVAGIMFILIYSPCFKDTLYETTSTKEKFGFSFLFNVAMGFGCKIISLYEQIGEGIKWNNLRKPFFPGDNFAFSDAMLMLVADTCLHVTVFWYVDNINPGVYGLPQPWYFPFTKHYWWGKTYHFGGSEIAPIHISDYFEKEPSGMEIGVSVKGLRKVFGRGTKKIIAVKNMHLTMYEGQITALLGHNGAGKTTTLSVLTGFIPPTSGTAIVNGYDIRTDIAAVRRSLGLCPQHNILFDTLTVEEHLRFFAQLKGITKEHLNREITGIVEDTGLHIKRYELSRTLSGGQKRKLAVGIALIGNSKIVILDEPTSGLDPSSRRHTWDLLQRHKERRTQVLTTHFMDEADALGDRIAIMVEGDVKCCGTSHFLKKLFGKGYQLVIVKKPECNIKAVTELVQRFIPTSKLKSIVNAEVTYLLPDDQSHLFAKLFTEIENKLDRLGILNFGASATTMEEVFLKVVESSEKSHHYSDDKHKHKLQTCFSIPNGRLLDYCEGYVKKKGLALLLCQLHALIVKKAYYTWRNWKITLTQMVVPAICMMLALWLEKKGFRYAGEQILKIDLSRYLSGKVPYSSVSSASSLANNLSESYSSLFSGKHKSQDIKESNDLSKYLLLKAKDMGCNYFYRKYIIAAEFLGVNDRVIVRGYYNGETYPGSAVSLNYLMNAIANYASAGKEIVVINHPLPHHESTQESLFSGASLVLSFIIAFLADYGMAFLTATFVYSLISERSVGSKQLQTISGAGPFIYWLSSLIWDYINYFIAIMIVLVVFAAFQTEAYVTDNRLGIVLLIFLCYGWSVLPFMYLLQLVFKSPVTGIAVMIVFNILSGLTTNLTIFVLKFMTKESRHLGETLDDWFITIFPHHCLGRALQDTYINYMNAKARTSLLKTIDSCSTDMCHKTYTPMIKELTVEKDLSWKKPGIGKEVTFMIVQGFVFFFCVFFLEYQIPQQLWYRLTSLFSTRMPKVDYHEKNEDSDIYSEKERIQWTSVADLPDALVIRQLYKHYDNIVAVNYVTLGVATQECFGLLGQNGAGKTTMFKMLVGELMMNGGDVYLQKRSLKKHRSKVLKKIGYCPQFDALIDQMTGRETLTMYARLHGIPHRHVNRVVNSLMETLLLTEHASKLVSQFSGGNKRKLSTAVALIGNPALILLDEPSTGMDPAARRQLWNVLSEVRASGKTLILTTHSMEECDALCTRMAIMVKGKFVCLGSPQHLKSKFAQGYTLIARMEPELVAGQSFSHSFRKNSLLMCSNTLISYVYRKFPDAKIFETHEGYAHFQVPSANISLAEIFETMEFARLNLNVIDYSVHQTTLEQVFLSFVGSQAAQSEEKTTFWKKVLPCL